MEIWQIISLTLLAFLKKTDHKGTQIAIYNSMFWGSMAGLVMGDFRMGLCIGGTFQLMSLGVTAIGGASVPDYQVGAIISTAVAVSTGQGMETGIAIGLPVAMICIQLDVVMNLFHGFLVRKSQSYCNQGRYRKMEQMIWLCVAVTGLSTAIPVFLAVAFGPAVVLAMIEILPPWFLAGLTVAGKILPVCGIAALLLYMPVKQYFEYLLFGFVLSAYLNTPILGVALMGLGFAHMLYKRRMKEETAGEVSPHGQTAGEEAENKTCTGILTPADLRLAGWRWNMASETFNYETQMAGSVAYALSPALRKIYKDDSQYRESLNNHYQYFNITPWFGNLILGAALALEDQSGIQAKRAVQDMKVGLMGPVSGFGDSIFYVLIPTIFGSIGGYLALDGNAFGMIVWLLYGLCVFFIRPQLAFIGYKSGLRIVREFGTRLTVFTEAASALGLAVAGSLLTTVVTVKTPLTFVSGQVVREIQPILDTILPSMIAVVLTGLVMYLMKKKVPLTYIILLIITGSCFCAAFGLLI